MDRQAKLVCERLQSFWQNPLLILEFSEQQRLGRWFLYKEDEVEYLFKLLSKEQYWLAMLRFRNKRVFTLARAVVYVIKCCLQHGTVVPNRNGHLWRKCHDPMYQQLRLRTAELLRYTYSSGISQAHSFKHQNCFLNLIRRTSYFIQCTAFSTHKNDASKCRVLVNSFAG